MTRKFTKGGKLVAASVLVAIATYVFAYFHWQGSSTDLIHSAALAGTVVGFGAGLCAVALYVRDRKVFVAAMPLCAGFVIAVIYRLPDVADLLGANFADYGLGLLLGLVRGFGISVPVVSFAYWLELRGEANKDSADNPPPEGK